MIKIYVLVEFLTKLLFSEIANNNLKINKNYYI